MKEKFTAKGLWQVIKKSVQGFSDHKIMKKSASLAFYTIFSLGPLLIVIVYVASLFFREEAVEGQILSQIQDLVGPNAARQIQQVMENAAVSADGSFAAIVGVITLLVGATTMFGDMQDSINEIWSLKPNPKKGFIKVIVNRLLSFGVVASLGFLLLVSLAVSAIITSINEQLQARFPEVAVPVIYLGNIIFSLAIITVLFLIIFKVLPDARIRFRDVLAGAIATSILFMAGKWGISYYLGTSNLGDTYGAAGSLVIFLLWVYYSTVILYFGAVFTKCYAVKFGESISPNPYAVLARKVEVESTQTDMKDAEKEFDDVAKQHSKGDAK